ncbi:hypothetical protein PMAYCL1PPCAC_06570, partial [Pristionchus mayeri]
VLVVLPELVHYNESAVRTEETTEKETPRESRHTDEIIVTEDENQLSPNQLDSQDEPLRSTLHNGPLSQTVTELGGRPILSQAFDLGKATANEPYRIVRRERLRLPTYVHDVLGGVTPLPFPYSQYPYPPYGGSPYVSFPPPPYPYPYPYP